MTVLLNLAKVDGDYFCGSDLEKDLCKCSKLYITQQCCQLAHSKPKSDKYICRY